MDKKTDKNKKSRGNQFTKDEMNYIVARCLRAMSGKESITDEEMAIDINRGKNNVSILRRNLGFMYGNDAQTGQAKIIYKKPKIKKYYVNVEMIDVARSIARVAMENRRKEMVNSNEDISMLKLSDFYPADEFEQKTEAELESIADNIDMEGRSKETSHSSPDIDYDDDDESEYRTSDLVDEEEPVSPTEEQDDNEGKDEDDRSTPINKLQKEEDEFFSDISFKPIKSSLSKDDWLFFKSKWKTYIDAYGSQFDEVSDWDDLAGFLLEQIKSYRLFGKEHAYSEDNSKELTLCNTRMGNYKANLATSRKQRIIQKSDTSVNIADIIARFEDDKEYVELVHQAEQDLKNVADWARDVIINPSNLKDFSKIDGNESSLLVGLDKSYEELSKLLEE